MSIKCIWIKGLSVHGIEPLIEEVEVCGIDEWKQREKYWIRYYKNTLLNSNAGGAGGVGSQKVDYYTKYISECRVRLNHNTFNSYSSYVKRFLIYFNRINRDPMDINASQIRDYLNNFENHNTRNVHLIALKDFYKNCIGQHTKLLSVKYLYK